MAIESCDDGPKKVDCPICKSGEIGLGWTRDLMVSNKSIEDAMKEFDMTVDEVVNHLTSHEIVRTQRATTDGMDDEFYLDKLLRMLNSMEQWSARLMAERHVDKGIVTSLTSLTREMRATLQLIAEFQGRLDSNTIKVTVQTMQDQVLGITEIILSQELCEPCRTKLMEVLIAE